MRSKINSRFFVVLSILCLMGLITVSFDAIPCQASVKGSEPPVFSLNVENVPVWKVFEDITKITGYEIILNNRWKDQSVTLGMTDVTLLEALKRILRSLNLSNYSLIIDEKYYTVKVYIFSSVYPTTPSYSSENLRRAEKNLEGDFNDGIPPSPPRSQWGVNKPAQSSNFKNREMKKINTPLGYAKDQDGIPPSPPRSEW